MARHHAHGTPNSPDVLCDGTSCTSPAVHPVTPGAVPATSQQATCTTEIIASLVHMTIPTEPPRQSRPLRTFLTFAVPAVVAAALTFGGIAIYNSAGSAAPSPAGNSSNTSPGDGSPQLGNGKSEQKNGEHGNGTHGNNKSDQNGNGSGGNSFSPGPARGA